MKQLKLLSLLFMLSLFLQKGYSQTGTQPINAIIITDAEFQQNYTLNDKGVWFKFVLTNDAEKRIYATTLDQNALNRIVKVNVYKGAYNNLTAIGNGVLTSSNPTDEVGVFMDSTSADLGDTIFINLARETINPCAGCTPNDILNYSLRVTEDTYCQPVTVNLDSHFGTTSQSIGCSIYNQPSTPVCTLRVCAGEQVCLRSNYLSTGAHPMCGPGTLTFASGLTASTVTVTNSTPNAVNFQSNYCFTVTNTQGFYTVSASWVYFNSGSTNCDGEPQPIPPIVSHTCSGIMVIEVGPPAPSPQTFTYLPNPACKGGNVCFTASNPNLPGYYYTFNGNLSNPGSLVDISTTGQNICFNYPNAGTFNTGLIVNNGYCPSTQTTQLVTVNNPSVSATITQNAPYCRNYTFVANHVCTPENVTYTWNIGGTTYTGSPLTIDIPGNSSSVSVTLTASAPALNPSLTYTTTINNIPVLDASISHVIDGCQNITLTAQPSVCVPSSGVIYNWTSYQTGGGNSIGNPVTFAFNQGTPSMAFLLTATDLNGNVLFTTNYSVMGVPAQLANCCSANTDWIDFREYVDSLPPNTTIPPFSQVNWNTSQTLSGTQTHINKAFTVAENVVITIPSGANIKFFGCTFQMARGSKIIVNNNAANLTFQSCYLHGCLQLWEGIKMYAATSTTTLTTVNIKNCLIEDAVTALDASSTGVYQKIIVDKTIFNQNIDGIKYINKPGAGIGGTQNRLDVYNSVFTCKTYTYTPGALGAAIFNGVLSYNNFLANAQNAIPLTKPAFQYHAKSMTGLDVQGLAVGTNTCTNRPSYSPLAADVNIMSMNIYDNLVQGINIKGLNLDSTLRKNVFKNITSPINNGDYNNYYQLKATAINFSGESFFNCSGTLFPYQTNKVGGTNAAAVNRNKFNNCYVGVTATDEPVDVTFNDFTDCYTGVFMSNSNVPSSVSGLTTTIKGNNLQRFKYVGVLMARNLSINAEIFGNNMNNTSAPNFSSLGVYLVEATQPMAAKYNVYNNTLTKVFNGTRALGIYEPKFTNNTINLNTNTNPPNVTVNNAPYNTGINIVNSELPQVNENDVINSNNSFTWWEHGIASTASRNGKFYCNDVNGTFSGVTTGDYCLGTLIYKNDIHNAQFAHWLMFDNVIGFNYNPNTSSSANPGVAPTYAQAADNRYYNIGTYYSYAQNLTDGLSNVQFYVRSTTPYNIPSLLNEIEFGSTKMNVLSPSFPVLPFNNVGCAGNGGGNIPNIPNGRLMSLAKQVATDVLFPASDTKARFMSRKQLLSNLQKENIGTTGDADIDNFTTAISGEAVSKLFNVDILSQRGVENADSTYYLQAATLNGSFVPTDSIEKLQQQVNTVYLDYLKKGGILDSAGIAVLQPIAALCPYRYGTSIWEARAILVGYDNTEYFNLCEYYSEPQDNSNARFAQLVDDVQNTELNTISIYPNPNTGSFKIELQELSGEVKIEVVSSMGSLVKQLNYVVNEDRNLVEVQDLPQGLYFVIVKANGITIGSNKVIVTK